MSSKPPPGAHDAAAPGDALPARPEAEARGRLAVPRRASAAEILSLAGYRAELEYALGVPFSDGNRLEPLHNGIEIFPAMLRAIRASRASIDFLTYVYWSGDIAREFASALAQRSRAGARVRVLLDAYGSIPMDRELVRTLRDGGVQVRRFRPLLPRFWRMDNRTHRKILVCDNAVGFTGGVGIGEQWEGDARHPGEWRDLHCEIRGPAIRGLRVAFKDNWNEAGPWEWEPPAQEPPYPADGVPVQVVRASSSIGWTDTATLLRSLVSVARQSLRLVAPYFVPDPVLRALLVDAARRGVDVRLLVPGRHHDSRLSQLAGHPDIEAVLEAGVRVFRYQQTMLHTKLVIVDGQVASIGSANLNHRSEGKDEECCVVVLSSELALGLEQRFQRDCHDADELGHAAWADRGAGLRIQERLARLLQGQL